MQLIVNFKQKQIINNKLKTNENLFIVRISQTGFSVGSFCFARIPTLISKVFTPNCWQSTSKIKIKINIMRLSIHFLLTKKEVTRVNTAGHPLSQPPLYW